MITFETKTTTDRKPILSDVDDDQFFVDNSGFLCQKVGSNRIITIADAEGQPIAGFLDFGEFGEALPIKRILPEITKINF